MSSEIKDFFDLMDDMAVLVVAYDNSDILYMNFNAREYMNNNARAFDFIRNTENIHEIMGQEKRIDIIVNRTKGRLMRMLFDGEDSIVVYLERGNIATLEELTSEEFYVVDEKPKRLIDRKEIVLRENGAIIESLCKDYISLFLVDEIGGRMNLLYSDGHFMDYVRSFDNYEKIISNYCDNYVLERYSKDVKLKTGLNNVITRLSVQDTYQVIFQMKNREWRAFHYSKIEGESDEKLYMVGIKKFDRDMQAYLSTNNADDIIKSFTEEYQVMYRVNLNTGELYVISMKIDNHNIFYATNNNFEQEKVYCNIYVDPRDREAYKNTLSYERLKQYFSDNKDKDKGSITFRYREISGKWIEIRCISDNGFSELTPFVIFAIRECDEAIEMETRKYISEMALSKVFIASVLLDVERDNYESLYDVASIKGFNKKGKFSLLMEELKKNVYEEDFNELIKVFDEIKDIRNGFVEREFRALDKNGMTHFYGAMVTNIQLTIGHKILLLIMDNDERVASRASYISLNEEFDMTKNVLYTLGDAYLGMYYFDFGAGIIKTLRLPVDMCDIFEATDRIESFTQIYIKQMVHPEDVDIIVNCFSSDFVDGAVVNGKDSIFCEYRRLIDNEYKWVRLDIRIIKVEEGKTLEAVYAMKDINDEREIEIKKNKELLDATIAAKKANESKSAFLSNMSHDIRTPLNAIIGMTDLAINHIDNKARVLNNLQKIKNSGDILLYLINNILDMSYIESGKVVINESKVSLSELFHNVVTLVQVKVKQKHITFRAKTKNVVNEYVFSDKSTLNKIIINLLGNAIKYTRDHGVVGLSLEQIRMPQPDKSLYRISISDTGIGMSPAFVEKLFEPFEREKDTTMSGVEGTGLGMSITKQLVDLMGGTITVKSEINVGSVFTVEIPLKHDDEILSAPLEFDNNKYKVFYIENDKKAIFDSIAEYKKQDKSKEIVIVSSYDKEDNYNELERLGITSFISEPLFYSDIESFMNSHKEKNKSRRARNPLKGKKVLIVEDNEINIDIVSDYLDDMDMTYDSVRNGLEAYNRIIDNQSYDLILMDVRMPVMDGYEATKKIRGSNNLYAKTVPIVAMTANAFAEDVLKSKAAGMNDHISKPVDPDVFYSMLRKFILGE